MTVGRRFPFLPAALAVSLIANLVLWRLPTRAAPPPPALAKAPGIPRWAPPASPQTSTCADVVAARARELDRLNRNLARQRPYLAQYQSGSPDPAAKRWFEERVAPKLATAGAPLATDCRGSICRVELYAPSQDRAPFDRRLAEALAPFDYQRVEGENAVLARYVRIPDDQSADGRQILSDFESRYSWEGLREVCEREGPLTGILGVSVRIARDGNDDPFFAVSLTGRRGYSLPASTPAETCVTWSIQKALERVQLPSSVTRATLQHPFTSR